MNTDRDDGHGLPEILRIHTRPLGAGRFLLTLEGEFDHHSADRLTEALQPVLETDTATVLLDLSGVSFLDSTGITRLLLAHRAARRTGGNLALIAPSQPVERLLSLTGVDQVLPAYPDPDAVPATGPKPERGPGGTGEREGT